MKDETKNEKDKEKKKSDKTKKEAKATKAVKTTKAAKASSTAKPERLANGQFKKGQSGSPSTQFTTRPPNAGRKKAMYKQELQRLREELGEPISQEEYRKFLQFALSLSLKEAKEIVKREGIPLVFVCATNGIIGDIESKNVNNILRLASSIFAAPTQSTEITIQGDVSKFEKMGTEDLERMLDAMLANRQGNAQTDEIENESDNNSETESK